MEINEILFWKVFKNLFLFRKIFKEIETVEWISYDDYRQYGNRIKFKEITSLEWMLKNKHFELLKCKLMVNQEQEPIIINESLLGFELLLQITSNEFNEIDELLKLLFLKRSNIIKPLLNQSSKLPKLDLLSVACLFNNTTTLNILLNEPYSMKIDQYTLEQILSNHSSSIFQTLLSNPHSFQMTETMLNKSIMFTLKNKKENKEKILELIFNNNNQHQPLYKIPSPKTIIDSNNNNSNDNSTIKIEYFFTLESIEIQNKLIELDCINPFTRSEFNTYINIGPTTTFNQFSIIVKLYYKYCINKASTSIGIKDKIDAIFNQINYDGGLVFKELFKLFILESRSVALYEDYLVRYDQVIEELNLDPGPTANWFEFIYCMKSFSFNVLKHLIEIGFSDHGKLSLSNNTIYKGKDVNRICEFISLYTSQVDLFLSKGIENEIRKLLFSTTSNQLYEKLIDSISEDNIRFKLNFPSSWNKILPIVMSIKKKDEERNKKEDMLVIQDMNTLDWINSNNYSEVYTKFWSLERDGLIVFENYKLVEKTKIKLLDMYRFEPYIYPLIKSIDDCDIESLNYLLFLKGLNFTTIPKHLLMEIGSPNSIYSNLLINQEKYKIIQLLDYLNGIDSCNGQSPLLYLPSFLFKKIISNIIINKNIDSFDGINLEFKKIPEKSILLLLQAIMVQFNLKGTKFILDNFKSLFIENEFIQLFRNKWDQWFEKGNFSTPIYDKKLNICTINNLDSNQIESIINLIYFWVDEILKLKVKLEKQREQLSPFSVNNNQMELMNQVYEIYQSIIIQLYNKLIRIKNIKSNQIIQVYNYINEINLVILPNSIYYSFHYLNIRSMKLIKYVLEQPFLLHILNEETSNVYDCSNLIFRNINNRGYNIGDYLNTSIFNIDFILGTNKSTLEEIIIQLIYNLSTLPSLNKNIQNYHKNFSTISHKRNIKFLSSFFKENLDLIIKKSSTTNTLLQ